MRAHDVFAGMSPEEAMAFFTRLADAAPGMFAQSIHTAAMAMNSRPRFLMKQPMEKKVAAVHRSLSRIPAEAVAEETLAVYFLECRKDLLIEWLDQIGLEHEDGVLGESVPNPPLPDELATKVRRYRNGGDDPDREILLRAFAAQAAINWPALDALLCGEDPS